MTFERFTADHASFYCDAKPFYPAIQSDFASFHDWSNGVRVHLSAAMHDDLDWSQAKTQAERIVNAGKVLFWEIDFHPRAFSRVDNATFFAHVRALEEAVRLITPFASHTVGLCLYRGSLDLCPYFSLNEWEAPFFEWQEELAENSMDSAHYYRLFCMECFSDYVHRLISFLPDGLLPFAFFDAAAVSPAACAQLLSKESLAHLHVGIMTNKGIELRLSGLMRGWLGDSKSPALYISAPTIALCLPSTPFCDRKTLCALDAWMASNPSAFRILCEEKLTEEWEGVDRLVFPSTLSSQGMRKIRGFQATGGEITLLL
jgi:hypothetical protein